MAGIASRHGYRVEEQTLALYDLETDPSERNDVSTENPEVVERLMAQVAAARTALGDSITGVQGSENRPCGMSQP